MHTIAVIWDVHIRTISIALWDLSPPKCYEISANTRLWVFWESSVDGGKCRESTFIFCGRWYWSGTICPRTSDSSKLHCSCLMLEPFRQSSACDELVGCFVNTALVRVTLSDPSTGCSFQSILGWDWRAWPGWDSSFVEANAPKTTED